VWVVLVAVAATIGAGLAGVTFIRLHSQGQSPASWGVPMVTFTLAYSAGVGALAGALAGLPPLLLSRAGWLKVRPRPQGFILVAASRLVAVAVVAALVVRLHGGEWSADLIGAAASWLVVGCFFDFVRGSEPTPSARA
jgi:hypothetical protein